ncbi:MAG: ATP-binding protein, partial [Anaerolineae bacterium]|nr:ATP-binding protein [Anaerolineae bacterium]
TRVLAMIASALAGAGQRVLVTAFTHRAINNALRTIAKTTRYPHVFKVGHPRYADDLGWEGGQVANYEYFPQHLYKLQDGGYIVGGTCFALRTSRLGGIHFDTVIFDEAGQVTLPLAIAGMLAGDRYIFIGDHKQMAPVIVGEHAEKWVTRSIFETLFQHAPGTMLDITYRMNAEITAFPSRRFYEGRLRPAPEARGRRLQLARRPKRHAALLDPERPNIFVEMHHAERGMRAPEEARLAAELAAEALACGLSAREIAIVAPFRAQGRLIRKYLQELVAQHDESLNEIVVDTVERIQGQEREIVIVSLTTSDPSYAAQCAEFYFQPNRLNVAITRPRVKRIVIGSPLLFEAKPEKPEHRAWVEHFRALYAESDVVPIGPDR